MAATVLDAFVSEIDADPNGAPTISAGSNRAALLCVHAEHGVSSLVVSTMTIGGQTYTSAEELELNDGVLDMYLYRYEWNEAAIAAMSGTAIVYVDDETLTSRGWSFGTYQDVDQGSFPKGTYTAGAQTNVTTLDVTTTSVSGDRVVVFGMLKNVSSNYSTWDTLSEVVAVSPSGMEMGVGEGNGGDGTTTVTCSVATSQILNAIVFGADTGIQAHAMYHYRNHGKVF